MDLRPSRRQQELMDLAYKLAVERFAPRAADLDREAAFPVEDYQDLRSSGLLALCVPEEYGGRIRLEIGGCCWATVSVMGWRSALL